MKRIKSKDNILAHGESGHTHRVTVDVYEREDGIREFEGETEVTHEEHGKIALPKKMWLADRVMEYDEFEQQARQVRD